MKVLNVDLKVLKERLANRGLGPKILEIGLEELRGLVKGEYNNEPVFRRFEKASAKYLELLEFVEESDRKENLGFVVYTMPCRREYESLLKEVEVTQMNRLIEIRRRALIRPKCDYKGSGEDGIRVVSAKSMGLEYIK